ncbi:MAG: (d)CMP kinase [Anaerolineales bacterium]|nr:(d)CMP kinase [Anaerolineales bacterium]
MKKSLSIAIDGPAASGKSTLAEALAEKLGYLYFDTGAMYRAVTLAALRRGTSLSDHAALAKLAREAEIDLRPASRNDGRLSDVFLEGEDVTWDIRTKEVDVNVSDVSAVPEVRAALTEQQRRIGLRGGVVMAGRDIGTVVLPGADLKIYLDASPEERARRRHSELVAQGKNPEYEKVLAALVERDKIDSSRAVAPLKPADDAIILKTDGMEREEVLEHTLGLVAERGGPVAGSGYRVGLANWLFRYTFRPLFRLLFRLLCRIRIEGLENVPPKGPYIIAYNHVSNFEPPFVIAFWPYFPEAVAGADVFHRKAINLFVRGYGAIPVRRGEYDRKVIETMLEVLASGRALAIAPEGGRSHDPGLRQARAGVAWLMDRARVPVVPVGISGTSDEMLRQALRGKRPPLTLRIGPAFNLPPIEGRGEDRRAARQANADLVMRHIAGLVAPEHWGVYKPLGE